MLVALLARGDRVPDLTAGAERGRVGGPAITPVPSNRPLVDGPLVVDGPRVDDAPRPAGSEASAPAADAPLTVVGAAHILVAYKGRSAPPRR